MKKITFLFFALLLLAYAPQLSAQCNYSIVLTDTFGDGWNGVSNVDVFVDGVEVITDASMPYDVTNNSYVSDPIYFEVGEGDVITVEFNPLATDLFGDGFNECRYTVRDPLGNVVFNADPFDGTAAPLDLLVGDNLTGVCPSCSVPLANFSVQTDCPTSTDFSVIVDLTYIGSASGMDISDDQANSMNVTAVGQYVMGPYSFGTDVVITIEDDSDNSCSLVSSSLTSDVSICPPANDDFEDASAIACDDTVTGSTDDATLDEDDAPDGVSFDEEEGDDPDLDAPNVWYAYTSTGGSDEDITLDLCSSDYDSTVLVYTGTSGNLTLVWANDDNYAECGGGVYSSYGTFTADGSSTYYICITGWGVSDTGDYEMNLECSSSTLTVNESEFESDLNYYPNPVNNVLNLNAKSEIENISVFNIMGQQVMNLAPKSLDKQLDMSNLTTGTYFVKVTVRGLTETIRIIKK